MLTIFTCVYIFQQVMKEPKDSVTSLDISDHEILCGCADGHVRRYDIRMGQMYADYVGSQFSLYICDKYVITHIFFNTGTCHR